MANYHESYLGLLWIITTLKADATLSGLAVGGVWRDMIPAGQTPVSPYVIVGHQSGKDVITANAFRIFDDFLYRVEAHGPASQSDTLAQTAAQFDKLLGGPPNLPVTATIIVNSVTEGIVLDAHREQLYQLDEIINTTEQWTRFGGLYRLLIQQFAS